MSSKLFSAKPFIVQEFEEQHGGHRLVCNNGKATRWARHQAFTYLYGYVGVTAYHTGKGPGIMTPDEFVQLAGVGIDPEAPVSIPDVI